MSKNFNIFSKIDSALTANEFWGDYATTRPIEFWPYDFYRALHDTRLRQKFPLELQSSLCLYFMVEGVLSHRYNVSPQYEGDTLDEVYFADLDVLRKKRQEFRQRAAILNQLQIQAAKYDKDQSKTTRTTARETNRATQFADLYWNHIWSDEFINQLYTMYKVYTPDGIQKDAWCTQCRVFLNNLQSQPIPSLIPQAMITLYIDRGTNSPNPYTYMKPNKKPRSQLDQEALIQLHQTVSDAYKKEFAPPVALEPLYALLRKSKSSILKTLVEDTSDASLKEMLPFIQEELPEEFLPLSVEVLRKVMIEILEERNDRKICKIPLFNWREITDNFCKQHQCANEFDSVHQALKGLGGEESSITQQTAGLDDALYKKLQNFYRLFAYSNYIHIMATGKIPATLKKELCSFLNHQLCFQLLEIKVDDHPECDLVREYGNAIKVGARRVETLSFAFSYYANLPWEQMATSHPGSLIMLEQVVDSQLRMIFCDTLQYRFSGYQEQRRSMQDFSEWGYDTLSHRQVLEQRIFKAFNHSEYETFIQNPTYLTPKGFCKYLEGFCEKHEIRLYGEPLSSERLYLEFCAYTLITDILKARLYDDFIKELDS